MQQYENEKQHDGNISFLLLYNNTIQMQQSKTTSIYQLTVFVGQESRDNSAELSASEFQSCNPGVRPPPPKKKQQPDQQINRGKSHLQIQWGCWWNWCTCGCYTDGKSSSWLAVGWLLPSTPRSLVHCFDLWAP